MFRRSRRSTHPRNRLIYRANLPSSLLARLLHIHRDVRNTTDF
jgi:hypothetical protein